MSVNELGIAGREVSFDDEYRLKLTSRKLKSGKCQVKFSATIRQYQDMYGYVLVDADKTLRDVVVSIKEKLRTVRQTKEFRHLHLYSIGKNADLDSNFIIFDR